MRQDTIQRTQGLLTCKGVQQVKIVELVPSISHFPIKLATSLKTGKRWHLKVKTWELGRFSTIWKWEKINALKILIR